MLKGKLNPTILIWMMLAALYGTVSHAREESTGNWRIRYHESLRATHIESQTSTPMDSESQRPESFTRMSFEAFGRAFDLQLESNDRLITDLEAEQRIAMGSDLRLYRGTVVDADDSWVRLTQSRGRWSGMIWDGLELYIIDPLDQVAMAVDGESDPDSPENIIYRLSDTEDLTPVRCGLDLEPNSPASIAGQWSALQQHLEASAPLIAMAHTDEALELVVVADVDFVSENGANTAMAVTSRVNVVDGTFDAQVGVALSLVDIVELNSNGTLSATDAGQLLDQFSDLSFNGDIDNPGVAHLFTGRNLDGTTAGIAFLSSICRVATGVGLSETRGSGTRGAITVAHEIGHNFGAPHDNQNGSPCAATPSGFLMNPSLNFGGDTFSQCSLDEIAPVVDGAQCLVTVPEPSPVATFMTSLLSIALIQFARLGRSST